MSQKHNLHLWPRAGICQAAWSCSETAATVARCLSWEKAPPHAARQIVHLKITFKRRIGRIEVAIEVNHDARQSGCARAFSDTLDPMQIHAHQANRQEYWRLKRSSIMLWSLPWQSATRTQQRDVDNSAAAGLEWRRRETRRDSMHGVRLRL